MLRFFPGKYNIKRGIYSNNSSMLYTINREQYRDPCVFYPVTLEKDVIEKPEEIIKEKSDIINISSFHIGGYYFLRNEIMKLVRDMVDWYAKRKDLIIPNTAAIVKEFKEQGFFPFLSNGDTLDINIIICFYEKKEEEYVKKEECEVLVYKTLFSHVDVSLMGDIKRCLEYEFEKAWPSKDFVTNYLDFCITYKIGLDKKHLFKRPSFEDLH